MAARTPPSLGPTTASPAPGIRTCQVGMANAASTWRRAVTSHALGRAQHQQPISPLGCMPPLGEWLSASACCRRARLHVSKDELWHAGSGGENGWGRPQYGGGQQQRSRMSGAHQQQQHAPPADLANGGMRHHPLEHSSYGNGGMHMVRGLSFLLSAQNPFWKGAHSMSSPSSTCCRKCLTYGVGVDPFLECTSGAPGGGQQHGHAG